MAIKIKCIDDNKQGRKEILFKMFCSNCITTLDILKERYIDIPDIILKDGEYIFKLNDYVFVIKYAVDENGEYGFTINRNYIFKRKKDYWIKGNHDNVVKKFHKKLREYESIIEFYYSELFDIIYSNGLYHRYILFLNSDKRIEIYDTKENEITLADDIDDYDEFFLFYRKLYILKTVDNMLEYRYYGE